MAVQLPDGSLVSLATEYGEEIAVTAVTNAKKAVITLTTGHGIQEGDLFVLHSGWSGIHNRVFRADLVSADEVTVNADTTNTRRFKAGGGVGGVRVIE